MKALSLALALTPTALAAQQPYSESLADCAAFHLNLATFMKSDDRFAAMNDIAAVYARAAVGMAATEGRAITEEGMFDLIDGKTEDWRRKGSFIALTGEARDWIDYCRKFGDHLGLEIPRVD